MSKQIDDEELEKIILEMAKKIHMENAAHTKPVYSLGEILPFRNVTELRELAKILEVKNYSKLRKQELVSILVEKMQLPDNLRDFLYTISKIEWEFFQQVAAQKQLLTEKAYVDAYLVLQRMGLLQCFYYEDKLIFVVPDEIKATYSVLLKTNLQEEMSFRYLVNDYAIAAVSLYGVISQDEFVELFNSQNERQTGIDELFPILLNFVYAEEGYCFWEKYIVNDEFENTDFKAVNWIVEERKDKPRYTPPKEELLKYSKWDHLEETPQIVALGSFLSNYTTDPDDINELLFDFQDISITGLEMGMQDYFEVLDDAGITLKNKKQVEEITRLIVDMQNNTRQWRNYGHTPNEISSLGQSNLIPFSSVQPVHSQKIGRNDPCPCGSGKKYKKCCGKNLIDD